MKKTLLTLCLLLVVAIATKAETGSWDELATAPKDLVLNDGSSEIQAIRITCAEELAWLAVQVNNGNNFDGKYIRLTADIDLQNIKWLPIGRRSTDSDEEKARFFIGNFDGRGHKVSNLNVSEDKPYHGGLFGYVGNPDLKTKGGTIKNLGIESGSVETLGGSGYAGGICGTVAIAVIENCYNKASVSSKDRAGGICGQSYGTITNCYNEGTISVLGSSSSVRTGGIAGHNCGNSYAISVIKNCYNIGTVACSLVSPYYGGAIMGQNSDPAIHSNCYFLESSAIRGMGRNTTTGLVNPVSKTSDEMKAAEFVTLLGDGWSEVTDSYPVPTIFLNVPTEEQVVWADYGVEPADLDVNDGSSAEKAIQITSAQELAWVAAQVNTGVTTFEGKYIHLMKNIDLLGIEWQPIGQSATLTFCGYFNGKGYAISNLKITDVKYSGLFGYAGVDKKLKGYIKNVGIESGDIASTLSSGSVAGICGFSNAMIIENCYNKASVSGKDRVAGIVGYNYATVINCFNAGEITALSSSARVAGICAYNYGKSSGADYETEYVQNCYNTGTVTFASSKNGGAIIGQNANSATFTNCYYLDTSASRGMGGNSTTGQLDAVSKTEAEMKTADFATLLGEDWKAVENDYPMPIVFIDGDGEIEVPETWADHTEAPNLSTNDGSTVDKAILIAKASQLAWLAAQVNAGNTFENKFIKLTADIDLVAYPWLPIGNRTTENAERTFCGNFDGDGFTVSNIAINSDTTMYAGLFGYAGKTGGVSAGSISNLGVESGSIVSAYEGGYAAGVCAYANLAVTNTYSRVNVSAKGYVGGIVSCGTAGISDCFNSGTITAVGTAIAGGIAGNITGAATVDNCFNIGLIEAETTNGNTGSVIGCSQISSDAYCNNCYYLEGTYTKGIGSGTQVTIVSKTEAEMQTWAFAISLGEGWIGREGSYPTIKSFRKTPLTWEDYAIAPADLAVNNGSTQDKAIRIGTANELAWLAAQVNSGNNFRDLYVVMTENIDLTGYNWRPIGMKSSNDSNYFCGYFDGDGHHISNITVSEEQPYYAGLFGFAGDGGNSLTGYIKNLGIESGTIAATGSANGYAGGICGQVNSIVIENCYNKATITSNDRTGGIAGRNIGQIKNCYNAGTIKNGSSGKRRTGGIAGDNYGLSSSLSFNVSISNCYNIGTVEYAYSNTNHICGGILGQNSASAIFNNCYFLDTSAGNGWGANTNTAITVAPAAKDEAGMKTVEFATLLGNAWTGVAGEYPELNVFYSAPDNITVTDKESDITLYTNSGKLFIVADNKVVNIYSVSGQLMKTLTVDGKEEVSLPSGVYLVNGMKVIL